LPDSRNICIYNKLQLEPMPIPTTYTIASLFKS